MKIVVLDAITLGKEIDLYELERFGTLEIYENTNDSDLLKRASDADIIITNKVKINSHHITQLKKLRLICIAATGMDNVDINACNMNNIIVKNVKGYSTNSVTQHVFSMVLSMLGNISYYNDFCNGDQWEKSKVFTNLSRPFWELSNKRWGIIGLGAIGKSVANVASSFGCEIVYHSVSGNKQDVSFKMIDLESLLKTSDIISIHCPLTEATRDLLNYKNMDLIQDHAILVNVARGAVINSSDLVEIKQKKKFNVALDVFDQEPLSSQHILKELCGRDDVLLSPHIAWASIEARKTLFNGIVKNIEEFLN